MATAQFDYGNTGFPHQSMQEPFHVSKIYPDGSRPKGNVHFSDPVECHETLEDVMRIANGDFVKASNILDLKLEATNSMIEQLTDNLDSLTDEEFYARLTNLKGQHRHTLDLCERLYFMKTGSAAHYEHLPESRMARSTETVKQRHPKSYMTRSSKTVQNRHSEPNMARSSETVHDRHAEPYMDRYSENVYDRHAEPYMARSSEAVHDRHAEPYVARSSETVHDRHAEPYMARSSENVHDRHAEQYRSRPNETVHDRHSEPYIARSSEDVLHQHYNTADVPSDFVRRSIEELRDRVLFEDHHGDSQELDSSDRLFSRVESRPPPGRPPRPPRSDSPPEDRERFWRSDELSGYSSDDLRERTEALLRQVGDGDGQIRRRVRELWDETRVVQDLEGQGQERAPKKTRISLRPRSASLDRSQRKSCPPKPIERASSTDDLVERWRHRITVPQPFSMTRREEASKMMGDKKLQKSRALQQWEKEQAERAEREKVELRKQFRANPVPAHVYMPLYETMEERRLARREWIHDCRREILQSIEKPFKFHLRDEAKKKQKMEEPLIEAAADGKLQSGAPLRSRHGERVASIPKAKDPPRFLREDRTERIREEELLRQVKVQMRAERLFRKASAPQGMEERQRQMEERKRGKEKSKGEAVQESYSFKPRIRNVPDFKKLHQRYSEEVRRSTHEPRAIVARPFKLKTEERVRQSTPSTRTTSASSQANGISGKKRYDEEDYIYQRERNEWDKSIRTAMEAPAPPLNNSAVLRTSITKERTSARMQREMAEADKEREKRRRREEVSRSLRENSELVDPHKFIDGITREKTKELMKSDHDRRKEYTNELDTMKSRIKSRPLLVEKQAHLIAKQRAEKQYIEALRNAGLDEEFVRTHSAAYDRDRDLPAYSVDFEASVTREPKDDSKTYAFGRPDSPLRRDPTHADLEQ